MCPWGEGGGTQASATPSCMHGGGGTQAAATPSCIHVCGGTTPSCMHGGGGYTGRCHTIMHAWGGGYTGRCHTIMHVVDCMRVGHSAGVRSAARHTVSPRLFSGHSLCPQTLDWASFVSSDSLLGKNLCADRWAWCVLGGDAVVWEHLGGEGRAPLLLLHASRLSCCSCVSCVPPGCHAARLADLADAPQQAARQLWWPFTQHTGLTPGAVQARKGQYSQGRGSTGKGGDVQAREGQTWLMKEGRGLSHEGTNGTEGG